MRVLFIFFLLLLNSSLCNAQFFWHADEAASMPEPVSNNAVVEGWVKDTPYVFSFGGIDSTKLWSGIHLKSWRLNTNTGVWDVIPPLPDTLGKIAAAASWVDSIIYIVGGYHVYSNHNEASSAKVHRYDPRTNSYLSDGMDIPVPIDDHVQAVWNDSLIYVITGWSNNGNVPNVQIYDPANDNWLVGTPTPNNNSYKAFGATGTIIGNTIYYYGGARTGLNFPGQPTLRTGQINPLDPTQITWSFVNSTNPPEITYRSIVLYDYVYTTTLYFGIGGSDVTYNYNGIAYNGSGGVDPRQYYLEYNPAFGPIPPSYSGVLYIDSAGSPTNRQFPMDLRGYAHLGPKCIQCSNLNCYWVAGGMEENQKVSKRVYLISGGTTSVVENNQLDFKIYPNPTSTQINLLFDKIEFKTIQLIDVLGSVVLTQQSSSNNFQLDVSKYPKGIYFVKVSSKNSSSTMKVIVK